MLSFKTIKNANTPFKKIYKDAFDYGFSSPDTEKKYYSQMYKINNVLSPTFNSKISQCYLSIDVNSILHKNTDYFKRSNVEFIKKYKKKETVYTFDTFWYLTEEMEKGNTVSISVSLENYIYCEEQKDYVTHSIIMILHPIKNTKSKHIDYNMFWFNSHGSALNYTNFHYKKLSSTRVKKKLLNESIDFIIAKQFVESFTQFTQKNKIKNQTIHYETNYQHNYLCANLQFSDNHGCCFIFPILINLILHTNYNKYFINEHDNKLKAESTVCSLLEDKNVELFVYQCLAQIDERLNKHIITYYDTKKDELLDDEIEKHLDKYKEKFIKKVLVKTIGYIKHTHWSIAIFNKK